MTDVEHRNSSVKSLITGSNSATDLNEITCDELVNSVYILESEIKHTSLENDIFENFLTANEPTLLIGLNQVMKRCQKDVAASAVSFESNMVTSLTTLLATDKGARINISSKTDLVMREIEDMQQTLEHLIYKAHRIKCNLTAAIEEISIRAVEIKENIDTFEQEVVIEGVNQLTQKIPADKFVKYMQDWLKTIQLRLEKFRLRTSSMCGQYSKLKAVLQQKELLGESVHEVDFEKLRIENQHFIEKYEQKNHHLIELKRMNGKSNLTLTTYKNYLQRQTEEINKLSLAINKTKEHVTEQQKESELAEIEVLESSEKLEYIKDLSSNYKVPDIMEYIKAKSALYDIKKNMRIWQRRLNILKISTETYTRKMKNITGIKKRKPSWFVLKDPIYYEELDLIGDDVLEAIHKPLPPLDIKSEDSDSVEY